MNLARSLLIIIVTSLPFAVIAGAFALLLAAAVPDTHPNDMSNADGLVIFMPVIGAPAYIVTMCVALWALTMHASTRVRMFIAIPVFVAPAAWLLFLTADHAEGPWLYPSAIAIFALTSIALGFIGRWLARSPQRGLQAAVLAYLPVTMQGWLSFGALLLMSMVKHR